MSGEDKAGQPPDDGEDRTVVTGMAGGAGQRAIGRGTVLNGMYEIVERVGTGGVGEVYRAINVQTEDSVAIKFLQPEFYDDPMIVALFRKEAAILHQLSHPAIVRYYAFALDPVVDRRYIAMEYVEGPSLASLIKRQIFAPADVRVLFNRLAVGLEAAHAEGVVHRDISPDNVILKQGDVRNGKLIDFGIAKTEGLGGPTLVGNKFAGKYAFASPNRSACSAASSRHCRTSTASAWCSPRPCAASRSTWSASSCRTSSNGAACCRTSRTSTRNSGRFWKPCCSRTPRTVRRA